MEEQTPISVAKDAVGKFAESAAKDEEIVIFCGTTAAPGP